MKQDIIEESIFNHKKMGPTLTIGLITCHPSTWRDLVKEVGVGGRITFPTHGGGWFYRGIPVIENPHQEQGCFKTFSPRLHGEL